MPQEVEIPPALVQRFHELSAEGHSLRKMAEILQQEGHPQPMKRWSAWHHSAVRACLEKLGLRAPPRPQLKAGSLGVGAQRWEAMLRAASTGPRPPSGPAVRAKPNGTGPVPPAAPPVERDGPPEPAAPLEPASDGSGEVQRQDEVRTNASAPPAEVAPAPTAADAPTDAPPPPEMPRASAAEPPSLKIVVDGPCTAVDRRLWFALVRAARPELGKKPHHVLPLPGALALLPIGTAAPAVGDLWEAVKRLRASGITWEAQLAGRPLAVTAPLVSAVLTADTLTFSFPPALVNLLLDETQFGRLRMVVGREHDRPLPAS